MPDLRIHSGIRDEEDLQCWPCTADSSGHVFQIEDDETMIVGSRAGQTNALTTCARGDICVVHTDIDGTIVGTDQAGILCCALVYIVHETGCGIGILRYFLLDPPFSSLWRFGFLKKEKTYGKEVEHAKE